MYFLMTQHFKYFLFKLFFNIWEDYTVLLSNLSHQRDSTVPYRTATHHTETQRTETLLFKNSVTFKRDVFDPPQQETLH